MKGLGEVHLVVAATGEDGLGHFREMPQPVHYGAPEDGEVAFAWSTDVTPNLVDHIGGPAADNGFPAPRLAPPARPSPARFRVNGG